ncbi:MAG TPA: hypothetical protein VHO69_15215, partial [Phototrophicaceae bacterium]|nr:hypothetical protein [Phototrophicaceae bacterium]
KREAFYAVVEATPEAPIAAQADTSCKRIARRDTTTWAGPGDFYEAVNDLTAGTRLLPTLQTTDPDGNIWWQLNNTNWMAVDDALQTGECEAIPVMQHVPPPRTNTLSLETCKATNGPLRAGQQVTIEFIPQAFENSADAYNALKIDPGRIKIDEKWYRTQATDPIVIGSVGGERYIRRFYLIWEAKPGTYRIDGDRLHYSPSCTVTVPVG